jgi:hypothetical protein
LADEYHLFVGSAVVGGGTPWLPEDVRLDLELVEDRRFSNPVMFLRYAAA